MYSGCGDSYDAASLDVNVQFCHLCYTFLVVGPVCVCVCFFVLFIYIESTITVASQVDVGISHYVTGKWGCLESWKFEMLEV